MTGDLSKTMHAIDLNQACIPSNYSRLIARELGLQERDVADLLKLTQLSVDQFLQDDSLLTPRQQLQILQNSIQLAKDETLGLRLGQRMTSPTHGAMGFLVNSSPDLLTALKAFQAFLPTRMNLARLSLDTRQDWLEVTCTFGMELQEELLRVLSEIFTIILFDCAEFIVGRPLKEAVICFAHQEPHYSDLYSSHIPGAMEFGHRTISLRIPLEVCKVPNASANHENYMMALQQCETMLAQLQSSKSTCKYQIQRMMLSHPPGVLSEEEAAAALFISKRTLARRLKQEGTGFRQIRDDILSQQALGYLRDSQLSIEAMAELLNYHDSANFRRAFKRWFKVTPEDYRRQLYVPAACGRGPDK
ncbi:AraC family transcriptional regulator [Marinobacter santoriniensis NKSG1]|uniref:AraC family transcriptional regulator n=1 Tax=Marinobacter santoriniensis NKSG1 TaxID=1288826 RepID=M7D6B2_9GAMM|nr:AraC family transcriptional regulator [Marinobacter santoriniensis]EMP56268.1 AraC family transcriptional regulator [Marinobacter santoriniensis NKSG1]